MAKHKRTNFTDPQKAKLFARDRATCAFSGISLWLLDQGLTPEWEMDWADHLKPSARGGKSTLENGACVSSTFNTKKRDNGSDNLCFFKNGHVTREFVRVYGLPSDDVLNGLQNRSDLKESDWWFNRAVANSLIALGGRERIKRGLKPYSRDDEYWMQAALKRHKKWRRGKESASFASRGLCRPAVFGADKLVALESVETDSHYREWIESIWPSFRATAELIHAFDKAPDARSRRRILVAGEDSADVNTSVIDALAVLLLSETKAA